MSSMVKGSQLRLLNEGYQVIKSWTVPAGATTQTLFTVSGGNVLVTSLLGQVTTTVGTTATTLALGNAPTTGTAASGGIATATTVSSSEAGTNIGVQASSGVAGALVVGSSGGKSVWQSNPFVVPAGTLTATTSANAGGGVIKWYVTYLPIDTGASVA